MTKVLYISLAYSREILKKQMENEDIQDRLKTINKILNIGEITPDMLTIELTDAFIYKIIATSKRDASSALTPLTQWPFKSL